jgi:hypothetical protein
MNDKWGNMRQEDAVAPVKWKPEFAWKKINYNKTS